MEILRTSLGRVVDLAESARIAGNDLMAQELDLIAENLRTHLLQSRSIVTQVTECRLCNRPLRSCRCEWASL